MAGSLLELHSHANLDILNELSSVSSILYFKGKKIAGVADLSSEADNAIVTKSDGIYVNGKLLCSETEKELLGKLSVDPILGLMLDSKQVGHSHDNKSILDSFSEDAAQGLLYKGRVLEHSHDNKNILDKFSIDRSGSLLYNGSKLETELKLSVTSGNAIEKKADGLYVPDKSQDIKDIDKKITKLDESVKENGNTLQGMAGDVTGVKSDVNGILDSIRRGETFLGVDIDWISLRTSGVHHWVVNSRLVPDEHSGNMSFTDNIITLNPNRTYLAIASLRLDGGNQICYTVQDVDSLECFGTGVSNASEYMTNYGEQCLMAAIPTGSQGRRITLHVFDSDGTVSYQGLNAIITEIGRAVQLPHELTETDIDDAIQDTLRILDAVGASIEELNREE